MKRGNELIGKYVIDSDAHIVSYVLNYDMEFETGNHHTYFICNTYIYSNGDLVNIIPSDIIDESEMNNGLDNGFVISDTNPYETKD